MQISVPPAQILSIASINVKPDPTYRSATSTEEHIEYTQGL